MLTLPHAHAAIAALVRALPPQRVALESALGCRLAEDVASDVDSPPHDKSIVDGYAVRSVDFQRAARGETEEAIEMEVVEEVVAGDVPRVILGSGQATRIMTGAPIPAGADAVVMVEQTSHHDEPDQPLGVVTFATHEVTSGQNIQRRATSMQTGQVVLRAGALLRAAQIGLLAEVGRPGISVVPQPRVAVLPTGNELVPPELKPAAGQIRNSNGPMLLAAVRAAGGAAVDLGIGRDNIADLRRLVEQGLSHDVLLISGGVSAGRLDLAPGVLRDLGVREVFHKVSVKPGKPLWFGTAGHGDSPESLVFGLPGNPVSSLVCFELFVRPTLAALAGNPWQPPQTEPAKLVGNFKPHGNRTTYYPAKLDSTEQGLTATLLPSKGSSDLRTITEADGLVRFESAVEYTEGDRVEVLRV